MINAFSSFDRERGTETHSCGAIFLVELQTWFYNLLAEVYLDHSHFKNDRIATAPPLVALQYARRDVFLATKKCQTLQRRAVRPVFVTNLWEAAASDNREVVLSRSPACCVLTAASSGFTWLNKDSRQSRSLSIFI